MTKNGVVVLNENISSGKTDVYIVQKRSELWKNKQNENVRI